MIDGVAADRQGPLPFTVLTGFLGAGKTTLLNRLLKDPAWAGSLVLVNEIGEIGLDHLLMEPVEGGIFALAGGCLCCSVRTDLTEALADIARRRAEGSLPQFQRVVLETSGLADPIPVLHALLADPALMNQYALDGVVTVVDAATGLITLDDHEEARRQVAIADRIVLTKTDMAEPDALRAIRARLSALAPGATVLDTRAGEAVPSTLLHLGPFLAGGKIDAVTDWLAAERVGAASATRHDTAIASATIWSDASMPPSALPLFAELLRATHGSRILRLKGLVRMADDPERPVVMHGVRHLFHPPRRLPAWPDDDHRTRIVVVAEGLDPAILARLYDACAGVVAPDQPDRAALLDNPLAPRRSGLLAG